VVIICWNDANCILDCIKSVYDETKSIGFEIIVADNGSSDGSVESIRKRFPQIRIVENEVNLGFGKGNNAGICAAKGEYVLILNPDTIIHDRALEKLIAYADCQFGAGAFGCRTLNPDGSLQGTAQPTPTVFGYLIRALYLRWLARLSDRFQSDQYIGWDGQTEREIGFQAGCCLLVRTSLLKGLGGFDERFFHQFEDADLCHRVWKSGRTVLFYPDSEITHIGGQNRGRYPISVILETQRSKYKYFHKHYGTKGAIRIRWVSLIDFGLRYLGYRLVHILRHHETLKNRLKMYEVMIKWHWYLDPIGFIERGDEPEVGYEPLNPAHHTKRFVESSAIQ
jgi:GT2 family glycosyltransferase